MTHHLTIRLAWHDNKWDGRICRKPLANSYCVGTHSLLSERLARDKQAAVESENAEEPLDKLMPKYLPPCFWSSGAFATHETKIVHAHPFSNYRETHRIDETLQSSSVYTWPFRLSLTHSAGATKKHGQYPADLDDRIDRYLERLDEGKSLVFFYLNYDNPVSADDYRYAVVGCARLKDLQRSGEYSFTDEELGGLRDSKKMRNFPTRNWAVQVQYDFADTGVRLPYHEYLAHVSQNPQDEAKLDEIKVLVEESALLPGFKYVSEQVNDDACLYLLYKLRRAFKSVEDHGIAEISDEIDRIDGYIKEFWEERGLYPGLGSVIGLLTQLRDGSPDWEQADDQGAVALIRSKIEDEEDLLNAVFDMLGGGGPDYLGKRQKRVVKRAGQGLAQFDHLGSALKKLSLFRLTTRQIARVLFPELAEENGEPHPFGGKKIDPSDIAANPYLLCEEYVPSTTVDSLRAVELDREVRTDGPIDYFTIDIGMFPDDDQYEDVDDDQQNLQPLGPERLRAFAVTHLRRQQGNGHTYSALQEVVDESRNHALFYRSQLAVDAKHLLNDQALEHFSKRLRIVQHDGEHFFYLEEAKKAEEQVEQFVAHLVAQPTLKANLDWLGPHLDEEARALAEHLPNFDAELFKSEREQLVTGVLQQRLFLVTGRPGSGKTRALKDIIGHLDSVGEKVSVLAPTGKAALRVRNEETAATVETIDRWINRTSLRRYMDDLSQLPSMAKSKYYQQVENLIIDEVSMVDIPKLAVLFKALEVHEPNIKRVVLVGDENQLPPIGMGRPLFDLLGYMNSDADRMKNHVVRLRSNCRQRQDPTVVEAAYLFAGKNRYYTDLYGSLLKGREISEFLRVEYWQDAEELNAKLIERLNSTLGIAAGANHEDCEKSLNTHFNLRENGYAKDQRKAGNELNLEAWQLLTPYRGGPSGTINTNNVVRMKYRVGSFPESKFDKPWWQPSKFGHSDKIIRVRNFYAWNKEEKRRELKLSNGSIGVLCSNKKGRLSFFPEVDEPVWWSTMDEDDFEAAYAITVHKSQGSEFGSVFVIIPERQALLSRELVYTAMTRSTGALTMLVQKSERQNPLDIARERSDLLRRNSSLFSTPSDYRRVYRPEEGCKPVKSKIEYMIYTALRVARDENKLTFAYEDELELPFENGNVTVRPDFTVVANGKTYYWEHLGMLDREDYARNWRERRDAFEKAGLLPQLITSDDMRGVSEERIQTIITDMLAGALTGSAEDEFSKCHYSL